MLAYQYLQTLPEMARGDANKVWVVPSDFSAALQGFTKLLGTPGQDGVFRYEPSPVEDLPKHASKPRTTPKSPTGSPPRTRPPRSPSPGRGDSPPAGRRAARGAAATR